VEDGKASQRPVEIGIIVGDRVQVKKGLKGGDELIVDGHRLVGDGTHVNVVR
jgi:multidrug efflux pump subunit AcrA (membrane-fusion protein)